MLDIWGFLLQTLTASGVAALLLVIKALFRDKLPPKWQFAVWGVLGLLILLPAELFGRYTLVHWQVPVEWLKILFAEHTVTRVLLPVPVLTGLPRTLGDWVFAAYVLGVLLCLVRYAVSYIRLRRVLKLGAAPDENTMTRLCAVASGLGVRPCRVVAVPGLPGAFVCGVVRPVLAVPAGEVPDDKVLLHELLHLKNRDTLWSVVICLLRSIHWCNPLLRYCARQALGDLEARCDQQVLERLSGEERRDYGRILLSMANDRFAKTPGSTCINNGGKNIRARIEAIARFKKYPAGMELVSVCVILVLALSLVIGVQASAVYDPGNSLQLSLASARSTPCTTPAGAFDTYAKAILDQNGLYRSMCAPASMQAEIFDEMLEKDKTGIYPNWDCGLNAWPNTQSGYYIYNLREQGNTYEGLLVVELNYPPDGQPEQEGKIYLAVQNLRVEKEQGRWVTIPLEAFRNVEASKQSLAWGCMELPGIVYSGTASDMRADVKVQTVYTVESTVQTDNNFLFGNSTYYDTTPKPNAAFTRAARTQSVALTHLGAASERNAITQLGLSVAPMYQGEERLEDLPAATGVNSAGGSNTGESWSSQKTQPGWGPTIEFSGGGGTFDPERDVVLPEYYAADLYVNNELAAQLDLHLREETQ